MLRLWVCGYVLAGVKIENHRVFESEGEALVYASIISTELLCEKIVMWELTDWPARRK